MTDYIITGEQLMALCLDLHPDIIKDLCSRPLSSALKAEREWVLRELQNVIAQHCGEGIHKGWVLACPVDMWIVKVLRSEQP